MSLKKSEHHQPSSEQAGLSKIEIVNDAKAAVIGADVVCSEYGPVWGKRMKLNTAVKHSKDSR